MSAELRPGYKVTAVGAIPEEWEVRFLDQCAQIRSGVAKNSNAKVTNPLRVHYLRVANVQDGFLDLSDMSEIEIDRADLQRFSVLPGDVLMNEGGDRDKLGRGCIWSGELSPCVHQNHVFVIRCHVMISPNYLTSWTRSSAAKQYFINAGSQTTNLASINKTALGQLPIPLPPTRAEQEAIAEALGDVDALLGSLTQLIAEKRDIKQAAMQQLLTGLLRLPGFTGAWISYTFEDLFDFLRNSSNSRADLAPDGEIGYLHYGDIHTHDSQFLDCSRDLRTFISAEKVRGAALMADGDLVMVDASEDTEAIGKAVEIVGLDGLKAVAGLHTMLLRTKGRRLADGFKGYLQNLPGVRHALVRMATGVSVYGITRSNVRTISSEIPDVDEQRAIAAVLSEMDAEITALERRLAKTRALKQGMMQELLTGRTRLV